MTSAFVFLEPNRHENQSFQGDAGRHLVTGGGEVPKSKSCSRYFE